MKTIETSILINSSPEEVWSLLTDFSRMSEWNPFIHHISGVVEKGNTIKVTAQLPGGKGMTFNPVLLNVDENKEMRWKGKFLIPGLFDGEHYFRIEEVDSRHIRFIHGEIFSGFLIFFLGGMLKDTEKGFNQMNEALKSRAEKQKS